MRSRSASIMNRNTTSPVTNPALPLPRRVGRFQSATGEQFAHGLPLMRVATLFLFVAPPHAPKVDSRYWHRLSIRPAGLLSISLPVPAEHRLDNPPTTALARLPFRDLNWGSAPPDRGGHTF